MTTNSEPMRVLITRAGPDATLLRAQLEMLGMTVFELSTIEIEPPDDPAPLHQAMLRLASYDWIVFTSRHAVDAICADIPREVYGVEWPPMAAVGPSTAARLLEKGLRCDYTPEEARASALVEGLRDRVAGARVLLPLGDLARPELAEGLRAAGAHVDAVIAYRTVPPPIERWSAINVLRRGGIDVIALASPSAFKNLTAMLGADLSPLQYTHLACIGPTTAEAVRAFGLEPAAVAMEHTMAGLVVAIASLQTEIER